MLWTIQCFLPWRAQRLGRARGWWRQTCWQRALMGTLVTPEPPVRRCYAGHTFALVVSSTTHLEHNFMAFLIGEGRRTGKQLLTLCNTLQVSLKTPLYQGPQSSLSKLNNKKRKKQTNQPALTPHFLIGTMSLGFPLIPFLDSGCS